MTTCTVTIRKQHIACACTSAILTCRLHMWLLAGALTRPVQQSPGVTPRLKTRSLQVTCLTGFLDGALQVVYFTCMAACMDAGLSDAAAEAEVRAAVDSVFPFSMLAQFLTLSEKDREQQLNELPYIVLGICVYNHASGSGAGAALPLRFASLPDGGLRIVESEGDSGATRVAVCNEHAHSIRVALPGYTGARRACRKGGGCEYSHLAGAIGLSPWREGTLAPAKCQQHADPRYTWCSAAHRKRKARTCCGSMSHGLSSSDMPPVHACTETG